MVRFVTSNEGKVREARSALDRPVEQVDYDYTEIQAPDLESIATVGAREAFHELGGEEPVLVDDSGLFLDAFDGFPGPYSAYVEDTVGIEHVQQLVAMAEDDRAWFRSVVAYAYRNEDLDPDADADADADAEAASGDDTVAVECFDGAVPGRIVPPRGDGGFGYDPIFEHDGQTMAERSTEAKNAISHRGRALAKLGDWLADGGE
jgi:XTP/dITP diphosphohydrolase